MYASRDEVLSGFGARDALASHRVSWSGAGGPAASGSGVASGVDARGNLVIVTDAGERVALGAGEVQLVLS